MFNDSGGANAHLCDGEMVEDQCCWGRAGLHSPRLLQQHPLWLDWDVFWDLSPGLGVHHLCLSDIWTQAYQRWGTFSYATRDCFSSHCGKGGIGSRSYWGSKTLIWCHSVPSACLVGSTSFSSFLMMLTETALHIGSPLKLSHAVMLGAGCLQRITGSANWEGPNLLESPLHVSLCPPGGQISSAARGVWAPHQLSTRQITLDLGSDEILPKFQASFRIYADADLLMLDGQDGLQLIA